MDQFLEIFRSIPCGVEGWQEIWGDPIFTGTVFMLGYGLTGWLMLRAGRTTSGREAWLWRFCAFLFFFQVANTHLDLHAFVLTYGRCLSRAQGWYQDRHGVQQFVLIGAFVVAALLILLALIVFRRGILRNPLLVAGTTVALGTTVLKGINHSKLEPYFAVRFGPFRGADMLELSGIFMALAAVLIRLRLSRNRDAKDASGGN